MRVAKYFWLVVYIYIYISSSSCHAVSTDISDLLSPPLHCFWPVFRATSSIGTELLYVCSSLTSCLCSSLRRGPQEYMTYKSVPTSPAVPCMSGSSNFDSFRDGWQVAVQLLFCVECCLQDLFNIAGSIIV